MKRQRAVDYSILIAGLLVLMFLLTVPTVFTAIAMDKMRPVPKQTCVDESGHFERECPHD